MAAAREPLTEGPEVVDLRGVTGRQLEPLLLEETVEWDRELDWDFRRSAELVRQYADARGLQGLALLRQGEVAGYGYAVLEDHKGLVGDLYLRPPWRTPENEAWLLGLLLQALSGTPQVRRIESQLMLLGAETGQALARRHSVRLRDRVLMRLDLNQPQWGDPGRFSSQRIRIEPWGDYHFETAAGIITLAYRGHVDSEINDQYRSQAGAHRFLYNIVQYPGCGNFFRAASHVAFDRATGAPAGVVLSSLVGPETGHITQLCVAPAAQGQGLGRALLGRALFGLRARGLKRVSLTVTVANTMALQLYERIGFREVRRFLACVWEA
jgi:ribosomal protein S18 acetylase RimI-like enzyme